MKRTLLVAACLSLSAFAQASTENEDLAYSLGVRLGERLQEEMPTLELPQLLDGLRAGFREEPRRLSDERIKQLLEVHEELLEFSKDALDAAQREQEFLQEQRMKGSWLELPSGVLVEKINTGKGHAPISGSRVQVSYRAMLADGSVFDESQTPQWFLLESLIKGWQDALLLMPTGSNWRLLVPSNLAYGAEGSGDVIPPYAALIFDLQLLQVSN